MAGNRARPDAGTLRRRAGPDREGGLVRPEGEVFQNVIARAIVSGPRSSVTVVGDGYVSAPKASSSILSFRHGTSGRRLWARRFDGYSGGWCASVAAACDPAGDLRVAGYACHPGTSSDIVVLGYPASGPSFIRGDCDGDGKVGGDVSDAVFLLEYNFLGGPAPACLSACDANGDGKVVGQMTDAIFLLGYAFLGGPPPPPPFPQCGTVAEDDLDCLDYTNC